jgi:signal peptidase I
MFDKLKVIKEIKSFSLIVLLVFVFRSIVVEPYRIPTGSMIPTLMIGDFILVNKFAYGIKVPFSDVFSDPIYIKEAEKPKRGDIIVFKYPKDPSINYVKRVVGIPGDEVEIVNKVLFVNGEPIAMEEFEGKEIMDDMDDRFKQYKLKFFHSQFEGSQKFVIQLDSEGFYRVDFPKTKVPDGQYFALGDNRDFSQDSRYWGFVPFENVKGRVLAVWLSIVFPSSESDFKFRWWRIGKLID